MRGERVVANFRLQWSRGDRFKVGRDGSVTLVMQDADGSIASVRLGRLVEASIDEVRNEVLEVHGVSGSRQRKFEPSGRSTMKVTFELDTREKKR